MVRIESSITTDDLRRTIRFIDTQPVSVSLSTDEAITHDVERYCAFRQDAFHEAEAQRDPAVEYLAKARDSRVKLLDSIDKAITLVHLLTNKDWGPGIPQMRFLSCRQSHPMRDKLTEVGNFAVAGEVMIEIGSVREQLSSMFRSAEALKKLLERLRARKFVFAMKCTDEKVLASIELVPASNPHTKRSVCTLTISGGSPSLILSPPLRRFVSGGFCLQVRTGSVPPSPVIYSPILDSIEDELTQAQSSAVDYAIIEILQNEQSASQHQGWMRTYASKHKDNFSVTFATLAVTPLEITVGLFPSALRVTEEFAGVTKALRAAYLEWCDSKTETHPHLSQHMFSFISASSS